MVQVDETYIGGVEPDLPGGRAQGKKVLTDVAVEVREPKGMGRCRMALLADVRGLAASVRDRSRGTRRDGCDRRLAGVQGTRQARVLPRQAQSAGRPIPWRGSRQAASRRTSGHLAGQAVAARHPSGGGGRRTLGQLPQRVRVPLQSSPFPQPGNAVLSGSRTRRRPRSRALQRPHHQPSAPESSRQHPPLVRGRPPSLARPPANRPWRSASGYSG